MEQQATEAPEAVADVSDRLDNLLGEPVEEEQQTEPEELAEEDEGTEVEAQEESDEEEPVEVEATDSIEVDGQVIDLPEGTPQEVIEAVTTAITEKERSLKSDYTQKTQEAAEMRKAAIAHYEQVQQQAVFQQEHIEAVSQLQNMATQLKEFEAINWDALADKDPVAFLKYQHQRTELREGHTKLSQQLNTRANSVAQQQAQQLNETVQKGQEVLANDIPGWGAEYAAKLNTFGQKAYGFTADELDNISDPRIVKALSDAFKYGELRTKGVKSKQLKAVPKKFVKPGAKINKTSETERRQRKSLKDTGKGAATLIEKYL
jgi:hypothetical protein|tara:strand:- start:1398 stop:2354 length:957 start_codon:yes stop_codon:yes gene_type:complete